MMFSWDYVGSHEQMSPMESKQMEMYKAIEPGNIRDISF
jgi:hypothetical protein